MSSVIIQEAGKPDLIFHITQKETIIGREPMLISHYHILPSHVNMQKLFT